VTLVGTAHAPSPVVRFGFPGLHSLEAACAPPSLATLVSHAGSWGMDNPSRAVVAQERFVREAQV